MMGLSVLVQFIVRTRFVSAENSSVLKAFSEPPVVSRAESHSCTIRSRKPLRITFLRKKGRGEGHSAVSQRPKQEVPDRIHQRVHDRRREDRPRLSPRPSIKQSRDRRQNYVAPVREPHIRNMRKPEQDRRHHPSHIFIPARPRQYVLQQPAEQELFGPRGKTQNRERQKGKRFPLAPPRRKLHEVHRRPQRNSNRRKGEETTRNVNSPSRPPADVVADAAESPNQ